MFLGKRIAFFSRLRRNLYLNSVASYTNGAPFPMEYQHRSGQEFNIPVPWGHIAAKEWGDIGGRPVLALHGMGDNLASFERLAPLFPHYWHVVAIDFPGFGVSPPLPEGAQPSILTMVADCRRVVRHLGWKKCDLIGHSFGGGISLLYAALFPEDVGRLVCLDPVKFLCCPAFLVRQLLAERITDQLEQEASKTHNNFLLCPIDIAIRNMVEKWGNSLTKESATLLVGRACKLVTKADLDNLLQMESENISIMNSKFFRHVLNNKFDRKNPARFSETDSEAHLRGERKLKNNSGMNFENQFDINFDMYPFNYDGVSKRVHSDTNDLMIISNNSKLNDGDNIMSPETCNIEFNCSNQTSEIGSKMALNLEPKMADHEELQLVAVGNTDWHKAITIPELTVEQGQALAHAISKNIDILVIQSNWKIPKWYTNMESFPFNDFLNVLLKHGRLRRVFVDGTHHVHMNEPRQVLSHIVDFLNENNIDYRSIKPILP